MDQKKFLEIMDMWADAEAQNARIAKDTGDERMHSIFLMKESMYRTMLRTIALKAPAKLQTTADEMTGRSEKLTAIGDIDGADRCNIQRACIEKVIDLVHEMGGDA